MRVYTRAEVGLVAPNKPAYQVAPTSRIGFFLHYDGAAAIQSMTLEEAKAHWLKTQQQHFNQGWADVGYNYGIAMNGDILEGRGLTAVGAHCPKWNLNAWGVQFMQGGVQPLTNEAKNSACDLYAWLVGQSGHTLAKKGHRDGFPTMCPGPITYGWLQSGMPRPTGSKAPAVIPRPIVAPVVAKPVLRPAPGPWMPFPLPPGFYFGLATGPRESISGKFGFRADAKHLQSQLAKRGWKITADGIIGDESVRCFRQFQANQGLLVDGQAGRLTWKSAFESPVT